MSQTIPRYGCTVVDVAASTRPAEPVLSAPVDVERAIVGDQPILV